MVIEITEEEMFCLCACMRGADAVWGYGKSGHNLEKTFNSLDAKVMKEFNRVADRIVVEKRAAGAGYTVAPTITVQLKAV
jgi:hypothetical protein